MGSLTSSRRLLAVLVTLASLATGCSKLPSAPVTLTSRTIIHSASVASARHGLGGAILHTGGVDYDLVTAFGGDTGPGVDLRSQCPPIYDQGALNDCTAFAVAKGLGEFLLRRRGQPAELSARALYYQSRTPAFVPAQYQLAFFTDRDTGSTATWSMQAMAALGTPPEASFPDAVAARTHLPQGGKDVAFCNAFGAIAPSDDLVAQGAPFRFSGIQQNSSDFTGTQVVSLEAMLTSLDAGMPVVFQMLVYENMQSADIEAGLADTITPPSPDMKFVGGHCVLAVGYDNARQAMIVRNSWGTKWGAGGYFYLAYDYFKGFDKNPNINNALCYDAWTLASSSATAMRAQAISR